MKSLFAFMVFAAFLPLAQATVSADKMCKGNRCVPGYYQNIGHYHGFGDDSCHPYYDINTKNGQTQTMRAYTQPLTNAKWAVACDIQQGTRIPYYEKSFYRAQQEVYQVVKAVRYSYKDSWNFEHNPLLPVGSKLFINDYSGIGCVVSFTSSGTVYNNADCPFAGVDSAYKGAFKKISKDEKLEQWYELPCVGKNQPKTAWIEHDSLSINPARCDD